MGRTHRPQVALYLDPEKVQRLQALAGRTGQTQQTLLRKAVDVLLADYEWMSRRARSVSQSTRARR